MEQLVACKFHKLEVASSNLAPASIFYKMNLNGNKEEELLIKIFNEKEPLWKDKYKIYWCDMCNVWSISCSKCQGSSCNCGGCPECLEDLKEFVKVNPWPEYYMNEQERKTVEKYKRIQQLLGECLKAGCSGLDLEWLYYSGKFCDNDWEILDLKFEPYKTAALKYPEKFTF